MASFCSYLILMLGGANIATMMLWSVMLLFGQRFMLYPGMDEGRPVHQLRWWMSLLAVSILLIYIYYMVVECTGWNTAPRAIHLSYSLDMIIQPMCAILVAYATHAFKINPRNVAINFVPFILLIILNQVFVTDAMLHVAFNYTAIYFSLGIFIFVLSGLRYEKRLKDIYASTYGRSIFWMWGMLCLAILQGVAWWLYVSFYSPLTTAIYYAFSLINWNYIFFNLHHTLVITEASMTPEPELQPMLESVLRPETDKDDDQKRKDEFLALLEEVCIKQELYRNDELTRDLLAAEMKISHTRLTGMLRETTGCSFYEYINSLRLNKAIELLRTTDLPVEQIGLDVGYRHRSSFYRAFVAAYGCSPTEWRLQTTHGSD